jgi:hypothetical protein
MSLIIDSCRHSAFYIFFAFCLEVSCGALRARDCRGVADIRVWPMDVRDRRVDFSRGRW